MNAALIEGLALVGAASLLMALPVVVFPYARSMRVAWRVSIAAIAAGLPIALLGALLLLSS